MKIKKIVLVVLFSILTLGSNQHSSILAEKEVVQEAIYKHIPQIKKVSISKEEGTEQTDVKAYLETKYGTTEWYQGENNTTRTVSNGIPIQMNGVLFPSEVLNRAKIAAKKDTTYLGCGPIAMIGMADFFARYLGYTEISVNPYDDFYQEKLATEILKNTVTWDVNTDNYGVQTFSLPGYCVDGFNSVMETHYLHNTIKAIDMGFLAVTKNEKIIKIKEQVDKGVPVTLYAGNAGDGPLGNHYVNVYGYADWHGKDNKGRNITHTMLEMRTNWASNEQSQKTYMDSDILGSLLTGIIYYDITYKNKVISDTLFQGLSSENNQEPYSNIVIEKQMKITGDGINISSTTRRLRCSYLNEGYLVLSANQNNHDTAYLEFEFEKNIRQVGLNLWKWSNDELFSDNASLRLEYTDDNSPRIWEIAKDIEIQSLPLKNKMPKDILIKLPKRSRKIRIIVENQGITTNENKGRIALHSIGAFFDTYNQVYVPHEHTWSTINHNGTCHKVYCECGEYALEEHSYTYETIDGNTHRYYCVCGDSHIESHTIDTSSHIHGTFHCNKCDETIEIAHNFTYSYESNGSTGHTAYCECGESISEEHTLITQNGNITCQYCNYEQEHIHQYIYEEYNETHHKKVCECGDVIIEEHTINTTDKIHGTFNCIYCNEIVEIKHNFTHHYHHKDIDEHVAYCECGEFKVESHEFNYSYFDNCEEFHEIFCKCGSSIAEEHIYLCESIDENYHQFYCTCGRTHNEEHSIDTIGKEHGDFGNCFYCNEEIQIPHSYGISYEYDDSNEHRSYCECGNYIEEEHEFKFYHKMDDEYHIVYCKCAKPIIEPHIFSEDGVCIYCNHETI